MEILPQLLINAMIVGSLYALAASGLTLISGQFRILNFAHGHLMMVGAYLYLLFWSQLELPVYWAVVALFAAAVLLAEFTLQLFILPFQRFHPLLAFVSTFALATILESVIAISFGVNVQSLSSGSSVTSLQFGPIYVTPLQLGLIISTPLFLGMISLILRCTPFGRQIRAIGENDSAGAAVGVAVNRVTRAVFIAATVLAVIAGIAAGYETNAQPTMGAVFTIKAFAAMILGGAGNLWGAVLGSYLLALVENLLVGLDFGGYSVPAGYKDAVAYLIILVILLVRPQGLFGIVRRRV